MLRHFNQDHVGRWTTATGLAISHATGSRGMGRKSDPFGVQITRRIIAKQNDPNQTRSGHVLFDVLGSLIGVLIAAASTGARFPSATPAATSRRRPAGRCRQDAQRQVDEFAEATRLVNGPAGNPNASGSPSGGRTDVAGRHGHRLPPPRPLRPVRLPPYPGGFPLRRPPGQQYRSENTPDPQRPGAFLLAKPNRRASNRSGTRCRGSGVVRIGSGIVGRPAGTKFSVRPSGRRNPEQGSALGAGCWRTASVINSP